MNISPGVRRRILDRIDMIGVTRAPMSRSAGGGDLVNRLAVAGILRLALRWPALSVLLIVSVVAVRLMARRSGETGERPRAPEPL